MDRTAGLDYCTLMRADDPMVEVEDRLFGAPEAVCL
jgi:hypothetical protein